MYNMYKNESEVETKFVYNRLLKEVLSLKDENIDFNVPVRFNMGREIKTKYADVVVKDSLNNNIFVIDTKSPFETLSDHTDQIDSYAMRLEVPISILTNGDHILIRYYSAGNVKENILYESIKDLEENNYIEVKNIIESVNESKKLITSKKEEINKNKQVIRDYRKTFRKIHTRIRSLDKLDPSSSFDEFSKALFIKIINDKIDEEDRLTSEVIDTLATKRKIKYIDDWFNEQVKEHYPGIFTDNEKIGISPDTLSEILTILDNEFDLKDSLVDVKGRAFEEFLPSQLRGKGLGQFFTPRPIVDFMVELANISFNDTVADFACGSGGFLIKSFEEKVSQIEQLPKEFLVAIGKSKEELIEEAKFQLFGIDAEPRAVRTAKMNMLLWGDGKQIQHGNGLDTSDYNNKQYPAKEYDKNDTSSGVDIVLANPPFGSSEEEQSILKNYELSSKKTNKDGDIVYSKVKTEELFVEKSFKLLKPGGQLIIILPEGIFSNATSKTRDFILCNFDIRNIIKLPKHTFSMSGVDTINTVILHANKREKKSDLNEESFISFYSANQIGYEPSGKIIGQGYLDSDLKKIIQLIQSPEKVTILPDPFIFANSEFGDSEKPKSWQQSNIKSLSKLFIEKPLRLDPTYHFFKEETKDILSEYKLLNINDQNIEKIRVTEEELNEDLETIYNYVSVSKNIYGEVEDIEEQSVDQILSLKSSYPQRVSPGSIVFNPYRINTGSIIYVDNVADNMITSSAYVVIKNLIDIDPKYFVQLIKTPFMKYQIHVLATGSVRDSFSGEDLKKLKVPKHSLEDQKELIEKITNKLISINEMNNKISSDIRDIDSYLINS